MIPTQVAVLLLLERMASVMPVPVMTTPIEVDPTDTKRLVNVSTMSVPLVTETLGAFTPVVRTRLNPVEPRRMFAICRLTS